MRHIPHRKEHISSWLILKVSSVASILLLLPALSARPVLAAPTDKSLIKTASDPTVYWFQNNKIYGVISGNIINTMQNAGMPGWSLSSITTVSDVSSYFRGPNFISTDSSSNNLLVKLRTDPAVYRIINGQKEFLSIDVFNQRGYSFNDVIDLPQSILGMFPDLPVGDFAVSVSPSSQSVSQGGVALYTVTVQSLNGFNSTVNLDVLNLPNNQVLTGTGFSPKQVTPPANGSTTSTLAVATDNTTPTGTFNMTVKGTSSGLTRTTPVTLTVNQKSPPTITGITPNSVQQSTFTLTIDGNNFDYGAIDQVYFGASFVGNGSIQSRSPNQIVVIEHLDTATPGAYTIKVKNSDGQLSNGVTLNVTPNSPPTITGITPATVPVNKPTQLTVNGSNFKSGFRAFVTGPAGTFEIASAGLSFVSSSQVLVQVTMGSTPPYAANLRIQNPDGLSDNKTFQVAAALLPAVAVNSLDPSTPTSNSADQSVTVYGSNFQPNLTVDIYFPNNSGSATLQGPGQIQSVTSNSFVMIIKLNGAGQWSINVKNPDGSQSGRFPFTVQDAPIGNPAMDVSPKSGALGTPFGISGSGFSQNGSVTFTIKLGDGTTVSRDSRVADSNGNVELFFYTSQPTDPLGARSFQLTDDNTGRTSNAVAVQYTGACSPSGGDGLSYDGTVDVTVPDSTPVRPGDVFGKIWRVQNSGTSTWSNYRLVPITGPVVTGSGQTVNSVNFSSPSQSFVTVPTTNSCEFVKIPAIQMQAPATPGTYYSYWQMQNSSDVNFGPKIYVKFRVVNPQPGASDLGSASRRRGTGDTPGSNSGRNSDPVNTATGNYVLERTDMHVPGRGIDFDFSRTYNSLDSTRGPLGYGWSHSFNIYLINPGSSSVSVHYSDGKVLDYDNQNGTYRSRAPGYYDVLVNNSDGTWTLQKTDQKKYQFNAAGQLVSIQDRNGNNLTLSYDGSGNLSQVADTVGRQFNFTYAGNLLTTVTDLIGRTLRFGYDGSANLSSFTDARNNANSYSYDGNHRVTQIVDGRGNNLLVNIYDGNGRVATQTNGRGNQYQFSYDDVKKITTVTDPTNKQTAYLHDANFSLQTTTDRFNNSSAIRYDEQNNNRVQVSDLKQNYFSYEYDGNGNVRSASDPMLNSRQAVYNSFNDPTQVTDELGKTTQMSYDAQGNLATQTDALSNASSITYNSSGQPLVVTDPNGNTTTYTYDDQGNVASIKDALNNTTTFGYDAVGRRTSVTNARGKTTKYTYDGNDNILTITDGLGNVTTYTYDANNNRVSMTDARGKTTLYEYDQNNLLVKETDALGSYIQYTYDKLDRRIATRDKNGNVTNSAYDPEGRLVAVTDPLGNVTKYEYDANGNRTRVTDAKGQSTTFTYDALNRVTKIQDPLGNTIQREYDKTGRLSKETDPRGNTTQYTYDAVGNLTQVTDAAAGTAKYTYDKNRNRITQTDPNNNTSNLAYDKLNRLISSKDPLNNTYSYTYDEVGNRASQTDAKGQTIKFAYDADNRLSAITYSDLSTVQLTYDANGNLTRMVDALGTTSYSYDELNRVTSYADVYGKTIGYKYDANGNITVLTYPDGKQVTYQYDAVNRLTSLTDWANKTTAYQYDSTNLVTKINYPNGTTTSFTYDNVGRLVAKADDPGISSYTLTLDANGNRTSARIQQPLANQLANSSLSSIYDAANRIKSVGATTFAFDANGNMISKTDGGVVTNYTYDFNDRLTAVGSSSQYFYNGNGTRLKKVEGLNTTRYVVDVNRELSQVLCETDGNGTVIAYYIYGLGVAYKVLPDGRHYYYHFDVISSTIAMTDDTKAIVNSYAYEPFGKVINSVENTPNILKFVGQYGVIQDDNGLLFMRARYYAPEIGRFLSKDKIMGTPTNGQSSNLFAYSNNNPINNIDPKGLSWNPLSAIGNTFSKISDEIDRSVDKLGSALFNTGAFNYGSTLYNITGFADPGFCGPNGGGSFSYLLEKAIPDHPLGIVDFSGPCKYHDDNYSIEDKPKAQTDRELLKLALKQCNEAFNPLKPDDTLKCYALAGIYYGAVSVFSGLSYDQAQAQAAQNKANALQERLEDVRKRTRGTPSSNRIPIPIGKSKK